MSDIEDRIAKLEAERAEAHKPPLTRAEIRVALTCPVCLTPGALLADKCGRCGSYQDESGQWVIPEKPKPEKERKDDGWFF
jgi:hypothetical protein